jgi:hypothetical protein
VTFRVADDLAGALRELPNQTRFVEAALRDALGRGCPVCDGTGRVRWSGLRVSDFREQQMRGLQRDEALQLKGLVQLARELAATRVDLQQAPDAPGVAFAVYRGEDVLLRGALQGPGLRMRTGV